MSRFWVLLMFFFASITQLQAKIYLVSVGIADYPGTTNDLRVSDNDAKTIAKVFEAANDAFVKILVNKEATQNTLIITMQKVFADAKKEDTVILYFSGHGTPGALVCHYGM